MCSYLREKEHHLGHIPATPNTFHCVCAVLHGFEFWGQTGLVDGWCLIGKTRFLLFSVGFVACM